MNTISIDRLVAQMSLDEQVALLTGADFWTTVALPRLGVPPVRVTDGPNGARGSVMKHGPATACFPAGIALAASWHPALVEQAGAALGREARLKGARVLLGPTVNLLRTVHNGRNFECYSEDPWLSAEMAVACVRGVQSAGVAATLKHFVGNESEFQRMSISSDIPVRALRELYLLPFERAVKEAGAMAVMTSYNRVDGTFMADHRRLTDDVLRGEWGFDGLVMTDWFAQHDTVGSVAAGCDLEMPGPTRARGAQLVSAVRQGRIHADQVAACAKRVLRLAQRLGSFEDPAIPEERSDDVPAHRALIRRLGAEGTVLLKNDAPAGIPGVPPLLPLTLHPTQTVALIGCAGAVAQIMGGGSATVNAHHSVAPLDAMRKACPDVTFTHHAGADIHRHVPVSVAPMAIDFFDTTDLSGPVVLRQTLVGTEALWMGELPPGLRAGQFSARATTSYIATLDGEHAFSLMSVGPSRATLNGEAVLDAWTDWQRGDSYFGFGCDEVTHHMPMRAGQAVEITVEYSSAVPGAALPFSAWRIGASRLRDDDDIVAAEDAARAADVAVVFAGLNEEWDCEGLDRPGMDLPHRQNELIGRVLAANPNTVVVLQSGSPLQLPWLAQAPAVLQAWYPGQECGHAIADVLLGHAEPAGRLPQTWPYAIEDTVAFGTPASYPGVDGHVAYRENLLIGYRHHEAAGIAPMFAFGHGLSYTHFAFENITLGSTALQPDQGVVVEVTVRNTGARPGSEVVQLYVRDLESAFNRPPQELKAFAKVHLQPGEVQVVRLELGMRAFALFDDTRGRWVAEAGLFELRVGRSSADIRLRTRVCLEAEWQAAP